MPYRPVEVGGASGDHHRPSRPPVADHPGDEVRRADALLEPGDRANGRRQQVIVGEERDDPPQAGDGGGVPPALLDGLDRGQGVTIVNGGLVRGHDRRQPVLRGEPAAMAAGECGATT